MPASVPAATAFPDAAAKHLDSALTVAEHDPDGAYTRAFGRLRRTRNQIEYDEISPITAADVHVDAETVRTMHAMAAQLLPQLPVFTG
ncbi:MAG: hypothetical protein WCG47_30940 [Dermatophilaceae bacterium]